MGREPVPTVDVYIARQPAGVRYALRQVRQAIRDAIPQAEESISYGMPTYKQGGRPVVYFAGWARHCSVYPITPAVRAACGPVAAPLELDKGTLRIPFSVAVPSGLVARVAAARAAEVGAGQQRRPPAARQPARIRESARVLRFPGALRRDPSVTAWLDALPGELGGIARRAFGLMRRSGANVRELMHDGQATACVRDAAFAYVGVYTAHVNVGFFCGVVLPDPAGLLEGNGKFMRHVKIRPGRVVDGAALEALIAAAYRETLRRLDVDG